MTYEIQPYVCQDTKNALAADHMHSLGKAARVLTRVNEIITDDSYSADFKAKAFKARDTINAWLEASSKNLSKFI